MNIGTLNVANTILTLVSELDEFKGTWRAIGRIMPERLSGDPCQGLLEGRAYILGEKLAF